MASNQETTRLLEEAYINNLPATKTILYDGWVARITENYSTNNNSVWPLREGSIPIDEKIHFCEQLYASHGQRCAFRMSGLPGQASLESTLRDRRYRVDNPNWVMVTKIGDYPDGSTQWLDMETWLQHAYRINPVDDPSLIERERQVLEMVALPMAYAVFETDGDVCTYGRSILQGNLLNIEELWTSPTCRNRGFGTELIQDLLNRGRNMGAEIAYLAVNESNTDARRLYERIGLENEYLYYYLTSQGADEVLPSQ